MHLGGGMGSGGDTGLPPNQVDTLLMLIIALSIDYMSVFCVYRFITVVGRCINVAVVVVPERVCVVHQMAALAIRAS